VVVDPGLTPQHFNQPACTGVGCILDNPKRAVQRTITSLIEAMGEVSRRWRTWDALSVISRRALLDIHAAQQPRLHPATRACLARHDLINDNSVITLYGRQVVAEKVDDWEKWAVVWGVPDDQKQKWIRAHLRGER